MHLFLILRKIVLYYNYFIFAYIIVLNLMFTILMLLSFWGIFIHLKRISYGSYERLIKSENVPPISILVPCYNEETTIVDTVRSLLNLQYAEHEVIVINDGSNDESLERLRLAYNLVEADIIFERKLTCEPIKNIYISSSYHNIIVVDKLNGGKADALNAGLNISNYPLVTSIDADSILEQNSLIRVARPFIENPDEVVAAGGIIRISNGCTFKDGLLDSVGLSDNALSSLQTVEYLRAFLSGRIGWSVVNGLLIVSGAFGIFKKDLMIEIGGYRTNTIGEDMEVIIKFHKLMRHKKKKYKIEFIPDPVCWTQGPEDLKSLRGQRIRWHRGLIDSLLLHRDMFLNPKYGFLGLVVVPYFWIYEMFGPVIEFTGYIVVLLSFFLGIINHEFALLFFFLALLFGIFLSVGSILLEEYSFRRYERIFDFLKLLVYSVMENFGFRQILTYWRFRSFFGYKFNQNTWGEIKRTEFNQKK